MPQLQSSNQQPDEYAWAAPTLISGLSPGAGREGFYGWRVVAAAFTVAVFGWGLGFYGPPVYLEVVRLSRGWPIALMSGAVTDAQGQKGAIVE